MAHVAETVNAFHAMIKLESKTLLLTLPGVVSIFVATFVSDFPRIRDINLPFVYLLVSCLSLAIPLLGMQAWLRFRKQTLPVNKVVKNSAFLSSSFALSVVLGLFLGYFHTNNTISLALRGLIGPGFVPVISHQELNRFLFLEAVAKQDNSQRFPDGRFREDEDGLWVDGILPVAAFNGSRLLVSLRSIEHSGLVYEGEINKYYSHQDSPQVYLSPACLIHDGTVEMVQGPGVWVNLTSVSDISFVDSRCSPCARALVALGGLGQLSSCPYEAGDG